MRSLTKAFAWLTVAFANHAHAIAATNTTIKVSEARTLGTRQLAVKLLGERLASRIIESRRFEYQGSSTSTPQYVEFFTQPEVSLPVTNGICRTDVITIEYDWAEPRELSDAKLMIARISATNRYKSFPEPPGEPGTDAYSRAHDAACAGMKIASDSFRAPSGGDAQWLAAIHAEYSNPVSQFNFTCSGLSFESCRTERHVLGNLALNLASGAERIDCPKVKSHDQVNYCYRLRFPFDGAKPTPDIGDYADFADSPERIITVFAGMRDGMAPVKIRSLKLEKFPISIGVL